MTQVFNYCNGPLREPIRVLVSSPAGNIGYALIYRIAKFLLYLVFVFVGCCGFDRGVGKIIRRVSHASFSTILFA